ncbi:right-handed parallel beta-helix repeat-containing protein [Bacillus spongiae]|uniref:Right-handed parallel beta-helix repeat-containing protein n=1 Tax=Bacillus spongiae TaxID=2683610 RepID=A0ABU8HGR4_9BACI
MNKQLLSLILVVSMGFLGQIETNHSTQVLSSSTHIGNDEQQDVNSQFTIGENKTASKDKEKERADDRTTYLLELKRWNIFNDGTHPLETTKGMNEALQWASNKGYSTVEVPAGTYVISKGIDGDEDSRRINMLSKLTMKLGDETVFQKEPNGKEQYEIIYFGPQVKDATLKGGVLIGDRDQHDYSTKNSGGTHEWGNGVTIAGGENITVDGVEIKKFTGDGIFIGGSTIGGGLGGTLTESHFEEGSLDKTGKPIPQEGKIRSELRPLDHIENEDHRIVNMWLPEGLSSKEFDVFYYKENGTFLSKDTGRIYANYSIAPKEAHSFRVVFDADGIEGVTVQHMVIENAKNIVIQNNDIGYNRRQGITAGGEGVQIKNNFIHHTNGTAPQAGIDIEPGFYPARNHVIQGNTFLDNKIQLVAAYGENVTIEKNTFEQTAAVEGAVGVHIHKAYRGDKVMQNNQFKGSGLTLDSKGAIAEGNTFTESQINLQGDDQQLNESAFHNASLTIGGGVDQKVSDLTFHQIGELGQDRASFYIGRNPVIVKDVTILADTTNKRVPGILFGEGHADSTYENLTITDKAKNGTKLVAGTYTNATFDAGELAIRTKGSYIFVNSKLTAKERFLTVTSEAEAEPEVSIKNSQLELTDNIGFGGAVYVQQAKNFEVVDSTILAENNTVTHTSLFKFGPNGDEPKATGIFGITMKGNRIHTREGVVAIDTSSSGANAPSYTFEKNTIVNGSLKVKEKDVHELNEHIKK